MHNSERLIAPRAFIPLDCLLVGAALVAAFCSADQVKLSFNWAAILSLPLTVQNLLRAAAVFLSWTLFMRLFKVYTHRGPVLEAFRIAAAIAGTALLLANSFDQHHKGASALHIAADFAVFCFISLYGLRAVVSLLTHHSRSGLLGRRNVLIVGSGARAVRAFRHLRTQLYRSHSLLGFVDSGNKSLIAGEIESLYLGPLTSLESILLNQVVDEVFIALPARSCYAEIERTIEICTRVGIEVKYPDDLFPFSSGILSPNKSMNHPAMVILRPAAHDARLLIKRFADITFSFIAIILLSPVMLVIAALIKFTSPGPVLFLQERYGLGRRRFCMFKFRTMVADAEARLKEVESFNEANGPIFKMRNDPRVTQTGTFLRRTSLDELPQLFNVFLGHMSLVGPRPMSVRDVSLFNQAWLMRRFSVKPGITCLWQVNGRSNISFNRWMELDLHYIDNWSLGLDAKILALTIPAVVKGSGAM